MKDESSSEWTLAPANVIQSLRIIINNSMGVLCNWKRCIDCLIGDWTFKASPSSRLPPAAAACCCVSGCRSSSGWRSDAREGQVEGTRCDPADQPRCRRGLWRNRPESVRPIALTGKAFCCLSAPAERIHEQMTTFSSSESIFII